MKVRDVMTPDPIYCSPETSVANVAQLMREGECGEIPVCSNENVVGVITDRDITCRVVAEEKNARKMTARDIMTRPVVTTSPGEDLEQAIVTMEEKKVRRLPVIDEEKGLVGILSASDVAAVSDKKGGELLRTVAGPSLWKSKMRLAV